MQVERLVPGQHGARVERALHGARGVDVAPPAPRRRAAQRRPRPARAPPRRPRDHSAVQAPSFLAAMALPGLARRHTRLPSFLQHPMQVYARQRAVTWGSATSAERRLAAHWRAGGAHRRLGALRCAGRKQARGDLHAEGQPRQHRLLGRRLVAPARALPARAPPRPALPALAGRWRAVAIGRRGCGRRRAAWAALCRRQHAVAAAVLRHECVCGVALREQRGAWAGRPWCARHLGTQAV